MAAASRPFLQSRRTSFATAIEKFPFFFVVVFGSKVVGHQQPAVEISLVVVLGVWIRGVYIKFVQKRLEVRMIRFLLLFLSSLPLRFGFYSRARSVRLMFFDFRLGCFPSRENALCLNVVFVPATPRAVACLQFPIAPRPKWRGIKADLHFVKGVF